MSSEYVKIALLLLLLAPPFGLLTLYFGVTAERYRAHRQVDKLRHCIARAWCTAIIGLLFVILEIIVITMLAWFQQYPQTITNNQIEIPYTETPRNEYFGQGPPTVKEIELFFKIGRLGPFLNVTPDMKMFESYRVP